MGLRDAGFLLKHATLLPYLFSLEPINLSILLKSGVLQPYSVKIVQGIINLGGVLYHRYWVRITRITKVFLKIFLPTKTKITGDQIKYEKNNEDYLMFHAQSLGSSELSTNSTIVHVYTLPQRKLSRRICGLELHIATIRPIIHHFRNYFVVSHISRDACS